MTPQRAFKGVWIPAFIWTDTDLTWFQRALLAEIDSLDDGTGCYASNSHLAGVVQTSPDYIMETLTKLRASFWVFDRTDPHGQQRRISVVQSIKERELLKEALGAGTPTPLGAGTPRSKRSPYNKRGTSIEPPSPKGESVLESCKKVEVPSSLKSNQFMEAWNNWIEFRLAGGKKKPSMPERMFELQLRKLEEWSAGEPTIAVAILETSMTNGWQGIFQPRGSEPAKPKPYYLQ